MPSLLGNLLSSAATSYNDYNNQQEQLAFQRQQQAQSLAAGQLANQSKTLDIQAQQNAINQDQAQTGFLTGAAQDVYGGGANGLAGQAQPSQGQTAAAPQAAGDALAASNPAPVSTQQVANPSLPAPLRNNNPGALMGKDGQLQKFPTVQAGMQALDSNLQSYGNKGINTVQDIVNRWAPASAGNDSASYIKDVAQRLGVDPSQPLNMQDPQVRASLARAIAIHENGRAAAESTLQNANAVQGQKQAQQQGQAAQQASNSLNQPSAADNLAARVDAGAQVRPDEYQQSAQATFKQASMYKDAAQKAFQAGNVRAGQAFTEKANTLVDQALKTQKEGFTVQKEANKETADLAVGVKDQPSYANFQAQIRNNPAMQRAVAGLNLTGQYDLDQQKLATLADRTLTLKDQADLQIKKGELQVKQAQEQRQEAKDALPRIQQQQAVQADQAREKANTAKGIPFAPSIAATAPVGTTPVQIAAAQKQITATNTAYDKANSQAVTGAQNVRDLAAQAYVMVDKGTVTTGGIGMGIREGIGGPLLDAHQQEFVKLTNNLVQQMQLLAGANGGARSASTAAMYANYAKAKPNLTLDPAANKAVAHGLYVGAAAQVQMNNWLDEYRKTNPDAPVQSGIVAYRTYEQALGPTQIYDPATKTMVPNTAGIPTLEDGGANPDYKDPHLFFSQGHF
jgi:hypothetical protein